MNFRLQIDIIKHYWSNPITRPYGQTAIKKYAPDFVHIDETSCCDIWENEWGFIWFYDNTEILFDRKTRHTRISIPHAKNNEIKIRDNNNNRVHGISYFITKNKISVPLDPLTWNEEDYIMWEMSV